MTAMTPERREIVRATARRAAERKRARFAALGLNSRGQTPVQRTDWDAIIAQAAGIVESYSTGVTLRQLHYQLVSRLGPEVYPNTDNMYDALSHRTADLRREGMFPDLIEAGRPIHTAFAFDGPDEARQWLRDQYRRDRTEGQETPIMLAVEKAGIVEQLRSWFGDLGIPIVGLGGYSSVTLEDKINALAGLSGGALIYAGDFDPSGEDIVRNLGEHVVDWDVEHIALTEDQVAEYSLPENPGKDTDKRAAGFVQKYGRLVQVELDALDPDDLRALYQTAIDQYWDPDAYQTSLDREAEDRASF